MSPRMILASPSNTKAKTSGPPSSRRSFCMIFYSRKNYRLKFVLLAPTQEFREFAHVDGLGDGYDFFCERSIVDQLGRYLTDGFVSARSQRSGLQRLQQIDSLARTKQFNGQDIS